MLPGPDDAPTASVPPSSPRPPDDLLDELLLEREHPLGAAVDRGRPRWSRRAARAVEQPAAEALLERAHLEADRGLGDAEALCRLREALELDDRAERGQLPRVHKHRLCLDVWSDCSTSGTA